MDLDLLVLYGDLDSLRVFWVVPLLAADEKGTKAEFFTDINIEFIRVEWLRSIIINEI